MDAHVTGFGVVSRRALPALTERAARVKWHRYTDFALAIRIFTCLEEVCIYIGIYIFTYVPTVIHTGPVHL